MELQLRSNPNGPYTYRMFVQENLDYLLTLPDFGMLITSAKLRDKVRDVLTTRGTFKDLFTYSRKFTSYQDYPKTWCSRQFDFITTSDLLQQVQESETVKFVLSGNDAFVVRLDDTIPADVMQVLGLQFTDGSYDRKVKHFTLYSTDVDSLAAYRNIIRDHSQVTSRAGHGLCLANDGCSSFDFRRGSVFGLLSAMIYDASWNKRLNREMLSRLSYEQFRSFFSGLIDGDGCLSNDKVTLCNYDQNLPAIQELLFWNGVYSSQGANVLNVPTNTKNEHFLRTLTLKHTKRAERLGQLQYFAICLSSNKSLRKFILNDRALVRVRSIEPTTMVPMADIETAGSYFHCRGVRVHNSSAYDIPYVINRIQRVLNRNTTRKLCLWDQLPSIRQYIKQVRQDGGHL